MKKILNITFIVVLMCILSIAVCGGSTMSIAKEMPVIDAKIVEDNSFNSVIVADAVVTDEPFGADNTGEKDSSEAIKKAIAYVGSLGGGTVYLPKGKYRITESITVDNYVTLAGNYVDPDNVTNSDYGTVIIADVTPSKNVLPGLFRLRGSSGIVGITVWYAQQIIDDVRPFPYTFEIMGGAYSILEHMQFTISNCTLLNAYLGVAASRTINPNVQIGVKDAHEGLIIENLKGTVLKRGIDSVNESDVGYFKDICFAPKYWANAINYNAPSEESIKEYTFNNGCGLMLGDLEWSPYYNIFVKGYKTGVHIIEGTRIQKENPIAFMGGFYNLQVEECDNALVVDKLYKGWGMLVTSSKLQGKSASVINNADVGYIRLTDTSVYGETYGNVIFKNDASIKDSVIVTNTPELTKPRAKLYNVVKDFGAVANGYAECSSDIQRAINKASSEGGGVVYLPAGFYKISTPLDIKENVQLRGCSSVTNRDNLGKSKGTIIFSYYDADSSSADTDKSFLTLKANAGIYGLRICYPNNNLWKTSNTNYIINRTPYTICAEGNGSYIYNVGLINSYNGIKVLGNNVVIKNLPSLFFNQGIFVDGVSNCHIENVISNATVATQSGLSSQFPDLFNNGWLWRIESIWNYYTYTETNTKLINVKNSQNVNVMSTFTFCSAEILKAENSNVVLNGCGADRMWQDGIIVNAKDSDVTLINQLKFNCMMFTLDGNSIINILGRMNLKLGNSPAVNDVENNIVKNKAIKDSEVKPYGPNRKITYSDYEDFYKKPNMKNPLTEIIYG